jgi:hypothetical protein
VWQLRGGDIALMDGRASPIEGVLARENRTRSVSLRRSGHSRFAVCVKQPVEIRVLVASKSCIIPEALNWLPS